MLPIPGELMRFRERLIRKLQDLGTTTNAEAGALIAAFDTTESPVYLVVKGTVSIEVVDLEEANEVTVTHIGPYGVFGFPGGRSGPVPRRLRIKAIAKNRCTVVELQQPQLLQLAAGDPDLMIEMVNGLSQFAMTVVDKVAQFAFYSARGRISNALVELCELPDAMTHPSGFLLKNSRVEIAKLVGCTREMVGRVMKDLNDEGLITIVGRATIVHRSTTA
ncbi:MULTISPECIES: helix-turn-helix domain-containing protein [Stutzerimonas]|jgi:CRP/FNR family transcriptional regulator, cyclic AMP receptor protein|nr:MULTISPECIES: helix-turn-helix domain-containing protein [Stutzerimonas]